MAYQTGSVSTQQTLLSTLSTFAQAQGWTQNQFDTTNKILALSKGSVYVQFRWSGATGDIGMFCSTGFTNTSTMPGNHTGDSGSGTIGTPVTTGHRIEGIGNGTYTAYHFFADTSPTSYIHCVVEYQPGRFRHFSFGTIQKQGSWTGGEYAVAHIWSYDNDDPVSQGNFLLWDGLANSLISDVDCGVIHIEGMPNQGVNDKWGVFNRYNSYSNDRQSTPRARKGVFGGMRGNNPLLTSFGFMRANPLNGFVPLIPIPIWWWDSTTSPNPHILLGFAPNVRHIQMGNFNPGDEITVGGSVWKMFPAVRKQNIGGGSEESRNMGIAYLKT